jgi:phosphatidylglycerophosphate synthase
MHVWRDRLHRWLSPLARRSPLSPNAITVLALLQALVGAYLLYRRLFLVAIAVVIVAGVADAFDGIVARVQEKASRFGDFLDHFCDRVADVVLLTGWLLGNGVRAELALAGVVAILLNGYAGTQIEATWHEREYETLGRAEFVLALIVFPIVSHILFSNGWADIAPGGLKIAEWMSVLVIAFTLLGIGQRLALARRLGRG